VRAFVVTLGLALSSCGSKSTVAVSGSIDQVSLTVESASALASALRGSFVLHVGLGQLAPSSTDATVQSFSLVRASDHGPLLVLSTSPRVAVHLEPGASADVNVTITEGGSTAAQELTPQQLAAVCAAGNVQIVGEIADTASGGPTPVSSAGVALGGTGCPPP